MQLFSGFMQQIESARAGATEQVSEVDLSDGHDVRATLSGLQGGGASGSQFAGAASSGEWGQADAPIVVHFGDGDFAAKYQTLIENIGQWRATAGRVESVDLRFSREAVVNPDTTAVAQKVAQQRPPKPAAARAAKHSR
jgi:cell division protein FtsQ